MYKKKHTLMVRLIWSSSGGGSGNRNPRSFPQRRKVQQRFPFPSGGLRQVGRLSSNDIRHLRPLICNDIRRSLYIRRLSRLTRLSSGRYRLRVAHEGSRQKGESSKTHDRLAAEIKTRRKNVQKDQHLLFFEKKKRKGSERAQRS